MKSVTISKAKIEKSGGMVVLPMKEYERLVATSQAQKIPEYFLTGKAARVLDKLVEEGERAVREGKTRKIRSLADLD